LKLERYYVPIVLNGPVNKGKLDKKVVEVEDDLTDFYLGGRIWKDLGTNNHSTNYPPY
jgi:hypothetical protein